MHGAYRDDDLPELLAWLQPTLSGSPPSGLRLTATRSAARYRQAAGGRSQHRRICRTCGWQALELVCPGTRMKSNGCVFHGLARGTSLPWFATSAHCCPYPPDSHAPWTYQHDYLQGCRLQRSRSHHLPPLRWPNTWRPKVHPTPEALNALAYLRSLLCCALWPAVSLRIGSAVSKTGCKKVNSFATMNTISDPNLPLIESA